MGRASGRARLGAQLIPTSQTLSLTTLYLPSFLFIYFLQLCSVYCFHTSSFYSLRFLLLFLSFPSLSSYLSLQDFPTQAKQRGLGFWDLFSIAQIQEIQKLCGNMETSYRHPNWSDSLQLTSLLPILQTPQPPGPALRSREKPTPQSNLPLTFSSLCPFSESVSLQPGSPGTGAARPLTFSV